jgi:cytoskeletal protein CcmA (bactofilin family)
MFGNKSTDAKESNARKNTGISGNVLSINSMVQGTKMEGTLHADSDIRIDGELKGSLVCKGKLIIGETGKIEGDIKCANAVIEGSFDGILNVSELLHIKETARINGEINTDKLIVQSGAVFNVSCKMGGQTIKPIGGQKSPKEAEALSLVKEK